MIVLKITNASEVVASRVGRFLESLTPDSFDQSKVEDILLKRLVENLEAQGLQGEVAVVQGLDLADDAALVIRDHMHVRRRQSF
ncbi:MAG: hypothetical protein VKJ66_03415 [Synechococcus sp.]|nr:hypothetical protein [Synechococcus sp.]